MTAPEWRDCADPDELAAAVAAGVVPLVRVDSGAVKPTKLRQASEFTMGIGWGDRYQLPTSWSPEPPAPDDGPLGIYVASRTIHAAMWKELRSEGVPIISTWLDEAGAGETEDFSDLWRRCVDEVKRAGRLVAFHSEGDVWKGAFIEIGVALGAGVPVTVVGDPPGSWPAHPLVSQARSAREAVGLASPGEPSAPPAPDDLAARARRHAYTHPESRHIIEELLDEVEMLRHSVDVATDAAPVPPWPGDENDDTARLSPDQGDRIVNACCRMLGCEPADIDGDAALEEILTEAVERCADLHGQDRWEDDFHGCGFRVGDHTTDGRCPAPATPVPPWPGAVLSGLVDEDGEPTWLAQAGQVRGEQVRSNRRLDWTTGEYCSKTGWVEVRAPRAVPEPETERVPVWEAVDRWMPGGRVICGWQWSTQTRDGSVTHDDGTFTPVHDAPTVEVLKDGGQ